MVDFRLVIANSVATLAFAGTLGLAAADGHAATQVLGLVASNGLPSPLTCEGGVCAGHVSSFCLQEARPAPAANSEYSLAPGGRLTLIATLADGRQLRLPGEETLSLHTLIGFTSVMISIPQAKLKELGAVSAAVEVGPMTTLLPAPVAGDPNPQSKEEIAYAAGPMRRLAEAAFEAPGTAADAARLSSLLINSLRDDEPQTAEGRDAIWDRLMARSDTSRLSPSGIAEARQIYRYCEISVASKSSLNLRSCMELHHADLMAVTNREFWDRNGGS